ncbi:MAG: hypothetical protein ACKVQS_12560 [Fimbriimonadaceae bacterium]
MKSRTILLTVLAVGLFANMIGCGGSGGTEPGSNSYSAPLILDGNDESTLTINVDGTAATGSLVVPDIAPGRGVDPIPSGSYPLSGTVAEGTTYSMSGMLPGGSSFTVGGTLPTEDAPGSYEITTPSNTYSGGLLPVRATKPSMVFTHPVIGMEPGQASGLALEHSNFPSGTIKYRYFIAAPAAYFVDPDEPSIHGQDIWTENDQSRIQTSASDSGVLIAHAQAYLEKDGVRTFLTQTEARIELTDVQFLVPNWVEEIGTNPIGAVEYHTYCWDFPLIPGAKDYLVSTLNPNNGNVTLRHRLLQGDIEATANTSTPIYFGAIPHSFPPVIPVTEEITGSPRYNFFRRGNSIRMIIVTTDPGLEGPYRTNNPITVKVSY